MSLPPPVLREIEERVGPVRGQRALGGGCVNPAARLELADGSVFVKYNPRAPAGMFGSEARALRRLREAGSGLRVPAVLAVRDPDEDGSAGWLLLEWLEPGRRDADFGRRLGEGLAALHRAGGGGWGWEEDGFIGPLPQSNAPEADWPGFWGRRRLEPQLRRARDAGRQPGRSGDWERLLARLPGLLAEAETDGPSLLHGDLWGGNVLAVEEGEPAIVDPSAYRGHREVDLAMSELFGGFDASFYAAYRDAWPLRPGYAGVRRGVYQLYYLLVHVNLFGAAYLAQTEGVLREVLAAG